MIVIRKDVLEQWHMYSHIDMLFMSIRCAGAIQKGLSIEASAVPNDEEVGSPVADCGKDR